MSKDITTSGNGGGDGINRTMRKFKTLERWIDEALKDSDKDRPCSAFSVIHKGDGGRTREIHTIKLGNKSWEAKILADIFQGKAETFAQDLGGIQMFELLAFFGDAREPEAALPFRVVDGELRAGSSARSVRETPDATGVTAQLMRHLERKDDALVAVIGQFAQVTLQREQRLLQRESELQDEVNDAYLLVRQMIMDKRENDHKYEMEKLSYIRSMQERDQLIRQAPMLLNTIAGKEVFPQNAADSALIDEIAKKVSPDKIDLLVDMGFISKESAAPLKLRIIQSQEKADKEKEELAKVPPAEGEVLQ